MTTLDKQELPTTLSEDSIFALLAGTAVKQRVLPEIGEKLRLHYQQTSMIMLFDYAMKHQSYLPA